MTPLSAFLQDHASTDRGLGEIILHSRTIQSNAEKIKQLKSRIDFVKPTSELGKLLSANAGNLRQESNKILSLYGLSMCTDDSTIGRPESSAVLWELLPEKVTV